MKIAGTHFSDPAEIGPAVRRQLTIGTVWNAPDDYHAVDGLDRAIAESGEWKAEFARAVSELLEDPDVRVRTGALRVLPAVAAAIGADRLVDLLLQRPVLYVGVAPEGYRLPQTLDGHLLEAIGQVAARDDQRAAELLRDGLKRGLWVHGGLARVDPDWVVNHAPEVGREALGAVLRNLPEAPYRERFVRELAPWPDPKKVIDHFLWGLLDITDAEKAHLRAIIAGQTVSDRSAILWGSGARRFLVPVGQVVQPGDLPLTSMYGDVAMAAEGSLRPYEIDAALADAWLDRHVGEHLRPLADALARLTTRPKAE